jgi:hypothetical protein
LLTRSRLAFAFATVAILSLIIAYALVAVAARPLVAGEAEGANGAG